MARTMNQLNTERATAEEQHENEKRRITERLESQIRDLDQKIMDIEREKYECLSKIKEYHDLTEGARQKCNAYAQKKQEEEELLKKELSKVIEQHDLLVTQTENTQEDWINTRVLTDESMRRCAKLSAELLWIPEEEIRGSNLFGTLSAHLTKFLDTLHPLLKLMQSKLTDTSVQCLDPESTIAWLKQRGVTHPLVMQIITENYLSLNDLKTLLDDPDEYPDMKVNQIPTLHQNRIKKLLQKDDDTKSKEDFKSYLHDFAVGITRILVWKEAVQKTSTEQLSLTSEIRRIKAN